MSGTDVAVPGSSGVAEYDPALYGDTGLEDVSSSDVIIPRLRIVHDEAVFQNNLTNEKFEKLKVVLLGLVKQRIMWDSKVEDGDVPQCKSPDFDHGFPNLSDEGRKETRFPWGQSNFSLSDAQPLEIPSGVSKAYPDGYSSNGHSVLGCSNCIFKEWDKGDWKAPPCSEQHTYPLLYAVHPDTDDEEWVAALLTVQKTGIKPSRTYISSFAQSKTPMFTVETELSLNLQTRGTVKYSVPQFRRGAATDRNEWRDFADRQRAIRQFVRSAPRPITDEDDDAMPPASSNENTGPAATTAPAAAVTEEKPSPAATPAPTPEPAAAVTSEPEAATDDGDDLPF